MCSAVPPRAVGLVALLAGLGIALSAEGPRHERTIRGEVEKMGAGTVQSFVTLDPSDAPIAIGITLSAGALEQLPPVPNTVSRCFDLNGDGRHTGHECMGDEERILNVPVESTTGLPFRWVSVNWNPAGHHNTPYVNPTSTFTSTPSIGAESRPSPPDVAASWRTAATSSAPLDRSRLSTSPAATLTSARWCPGWATTCSTRSPRS